jgi:hypothetical protein
MGNPNVPDGLRDVIRHCIPNVDAAELLLLLAKQPARAFALSELVLELRPAEVSEALARRYLAAFEACGLIRQQDGLYRFAPANGRLKAITAGVEKLYNEHPVTLVRIIYAYRDSTLRDFADAFSLKKR